MESIWKYTKSEYPAHGGSNHSNSTQGSFTETYSYRVKILSRQYTGVQQLANGVSLVNCLSTGAEGSKKKIGSSTFPDHIPASAVSGVGGGCGGG